MADNPKESKSKRRVVKNPETFRERALKASEAAEKPSRRAGLKRAGDKLGAPVAAPLKKAAASKQAGPVVKALRSVGKVILPKYVRNSWQELRLVTWPSWKESRRLTFAVLVFAVVFGVVIAVVDYGLDKIFRNILLK